MSQTNHLIRRNGVWYYRRRVPAALVSTLGKETIQFSLNTASLKQAKQRRTVEDLKWDAKWGSVEEPGTTANPLNISAIGSPPTDRETMRLVQDYVARVDKDSQRRSLADPPENEGQRSEMQEDVETGLGILQSKDDPRADEWIYSTAKKIVAGTQLAIPDEGYASFGEIVRRGVLELERRRLARLNDNHALSFFDTAFDPKRMPEVTFGELARQHIENTEEEATANDTSQKWVHKQEANVALLTEILGANLHMPATGFTERAMRLLEKTRFVGNADEVSAS